MSIKSYWRKSVEDWNTIFKYELRTVFKDPGVLIFFILVPLAYPLLYTFIYTEEVVREVPIAVVDDNRSSLSREYLRKVDATADVKIISHCATMEEAKELVKKREAYGVVHIPNDFSHQLARGEQTSVQAFIDMSGLLYYKAVLTANTNVSLAMNAKIKVSKAGNTTAEQDRLTEHPIRYDEVSIYNPQNGFASFLIPAVLILIIQQTLILGIGLAAGTAREHNRFRELTPVSRQHRGLMRIVWEKSSVYLLVYLPVAVYVLGVIPRIFHLIQIGNPGTIFLFSVPFLLACIFFAMTLSGLVKRRETCILLFVFSSVPLLFISGVSWPGSALPDYWHYISYLFPSTFGVNGFLKINNMGAQLIDIRSEWAMLWGQALVYFCITVLIYRQSIINSRKRAYQQYKAQREQHEATKQD
ncbi:ABC-2 type transporter [gut metagenome]|uniref:ABC-2 type transporter n=1 Tax=gut metagenome TaxID=749906 RepID=J9H8G4_9ZZZZ